VKRRITIAPAMHQQAMYHQQRVHAVHLDWGAEAVTREFPALSYADCNLSNMPVQRQSLCHCNDSQHLTYSSD